MGHCYFVIYVLGTRKCIIFYAYLCHINFFFHFFSMQCKSIKIQTSSYTLGIIETTLFYAIQHNKARKNAQRLCFIFNLYHKGSHGSAFQCSTVSVMVLLFLGHKRRMHPNFVTLLTAGKITTIYKCIHFIGHQAASYISTLEVDVILEELSPLISICSSIHIVHPFFFCTK